MARKSKIQKKVDALRDELWPDINSADIWTRKTSQGFTTIPRTLPLIGSIADALSATGKPVLQTYMELWCRVYDNGFVNLSKQLEIAFCSGFSGQRSVSTWKERMKILHELGFIDIKDGPSGPFSYALIYNPYQVVQKHKAAGSPNFPEDRYAALFERALDIGADDLE